MILYPTDDEKLIFQQREFWFVFINGLFIINPIWLNWVVCKLVWVWLKCAVKSIYKPLLINETVLG